MEEVFNLEDDTHQDRVEMVRKIHRVLRHPRIEIILRFFRDSSSNDEETLDVEQKVSNECKICLLHKRAPSNPKVGLPLSCDFNQCMTLDLGDQ